ncbi:cytochrome c biogenesis protein ResB [Streptomyces sp. NPDC056600]|uniref:cytochrome c biogenesis protein ResB n=1 Tax=Streptomyces sp. NPDC056600 TaxID=3345874 RepID=UPI0036C5B757
MSETTTGTTGEKTGEAGDTEAGTRLSTAPVESTAVPGSFGGRRAPGAWGRITWTGREVTGWVRWFWRQLTSMRTALLLLLLLSLAAVPGSLVPQDRVDPIKVEEFRDAHTTLAPLYDALGMFHVYSSVWFSAIYILLFVSLIGCIVPRTWQFVGQLRGRPPGAPRRLDRMPAYTTWRTTESPDEVRGAALGVLKGRRFRAHTAGDAVAAEKGYLRELGNLAFHLALIVMLIAFGWGELFKSEGNKLIVEGDGFANTPVQYDDFRAGSLFSYDDLEPFSFDLDDFRATFAPSGPNRGTPRTYEATLTYREGVDGAEKKKVVQVNKPLEVGGSKVYLTSHGYAPVVTVRDGKGKVVFSQPVPMLPIDQNITSQGAVKVLDGYRDPKGKEEQLGFSTVFVPTFAGKGSGTMFSQFPALDFPVLAVAGFHGSLGVDSGIPQNVYQLDDRKLKQFKDENGDIIRKMLLPGETMELPGGAGSITFEKEIKEWANFQVVRQPAGGWALGGALVAIAGLSGSLFIQRRRVWVRATAGEDGVTVVEMAGLGRSESARLPQELAELVGLVHDRAPTAPGTEPDAGPGTGPDSGPDAAPDAGPDTTPDPASETAPHLESGSAPDPADSPVPSPEGADK